MLTVGAPNRSGRLHGAPARPTWKILSHSLRNCVAKDWSLRGN